MSQEDEMIPDFPEELYETGMVEPVAEKAYRRGYLQGAAAALQAIEDQESLASIRTWVYKALMTWRLKTENWRRGKKYKGERPPDAPRKSRQNLSA